MAKKKIEKLNLPVFLNEDGEPIAIIYFTENRERVLFMVNRASEDEIIAVYEAKDSKIRTYKDNLGNDCGTVCPHDDMEAGKCNKCGTQIL